MSILSDFVNFNVPHILTMFNFVEMFRSVVNPLTTGQNFVSISFFVKKLSQKNLWGSLNPMAGEG